MAPRFLLAGLGLLWLGLAPGAQAATPEVSENMTVSPTQLRLEIAPGATATGHLTLINDGEKAYDVKAYAQSYRVSGEAYDQSFELLPGAPNVPGWIKLSAQTYHAEPHQSLTVPYAIAVPAATLGGGYYATLFLETIPKPTTGSGVQSRTRVGVVAYIKVPGALTERGQLETFTARFLQKGQPVQATLRLSNQGNVHYPADINLVARDLFGGKKADIKVSRQVLPGTIRRFDLRWDKAPSFGLFQLGGTVDMLGHAQALPARYVLILSPLAFAIGLGALVALAGVALWWWLGRRRRHD